MPTGCSRKSPLMNQPGGNLGAIHWATGKGAIRAAISE